LIIEKAGKDKTYPIWLGGSKTVIELDSHPSPQIGSGLRRIRPTGDTDLVLKTDKPDSMEAPLRPLRGTDTLGIEEMADRSPSSRCGVVLTKKDESRGW
jgi:hypothetical protein